MTSRSLLVRLVSSGLLGLALHSGVVAPARAQCGPAVCGPSSVHIDFEGLTTGASVEGLGAVHPVLAIASMPWAAVPGGSCVPGGARVIEDANPAFVSYSTGPGSATPNGCLFTRGFGDSAGCVNDYEFTFAPGVTVGCFSIRMVDYGDLLPGGGTLHQVIVTAYDAGNVVVDTDVLTLTGGVDLVGGDACTAGGNGSGDHLFTVTGAGIVRVTLTFDGSPDPNVGYDDISFCTTGLPTPVARPSWGRLKTLYRD